MRGMSFTGDHVARILAGKKVQTRRIVSPPNWAKQERGIISLKDGSLGGISKKYGDFLPIKPRYRIGETLYCKESFAMQASCDCDDPPFTDRPIKRFVDSESGNRWLMPHYRTSDPKPELACEHARCEGGPCVNPWKPAMFMPEWASRCHIRITSVKAERLQDISEGDAIADGGWTYASCPIHKNPIKSYLELWDKINPKRPWAGNPFVFVYQFSVVKKDA